MLLLLALAMATLPPFFCWYQFNQEQKLDNNHDHRPTEPPEPPHQPMDNQQEVPHKEAA